VQSCALDRAQKKIEVAAMSDASATTNLEAAADRRLKIALKILQWSTIGLGAIALVMVVGAAVISINVKGQETLFVDVTRQVFTALLPLLGTWVGTVLAFYFSKDNYQAASESMRATFKEVREDRLKTVFVRDEMRRTDDMTKIAWPSTQDVAKNLQDDVLKVLDKPGVSRLPLLDDKKKGRGIVHESLIFRFVTHLTQSRAGATAPDLKKATFADFLAHNTVNKMVVESVAYVPLAATLAQAKAAMEQQERVAGVACRDVFVTQNGRNDEEVLGWLTETRIERFSQLG
jgi:CBS domain-containing protein